MIELAEKNNLVLMVGHTFLYSAPIRKIKEIIHWGDIGDIQYISSRRLNLGLFQKDINVAWDLAPHDISIVLYIMEELPRGVNCWGNAHITPGVEDVTSMCINFSKDRFATIQSSWLDPRKVRDMTIVGTKRMIVYDDVEPLEKNLPAYLVHNFLLQKYCNYINVDNLNFVYTLENFKISIWI